MKMGMVLEKSVKTKVLEELKKNRFGLTKKD